MYLSSNAAMIALGRETPINIDLKGVYLVIGPTVAEDSATFARNELFERSDSEGSQASSYDSANAFNIF
jgi:hypothetical protein